MAKASKKRQPKKRLALCIVFDTNALFTKKEGDLLNHETSELIRDNSNHADIDIDWVLPDTVRLERTYQMEQVALQLLPSIGKLETILGHNLNITEQIIKTRIGECIQNRIDELSLTIAYADAKSIDWDEGLTLAAFRKAPFQPGEHEKGFRDFLIGNTFLQYIDLLPKSKSSCRIILVTNDDLLIEFVRERASSRSNIEILRSVDSVRGHINALTSKITEDLVKLLLTKAVTYFYEKGNEKCFYYNHDVKGEIERRHRDDLNDTPAGYTQSSEAYRIGRTQFEKKKRQRIYWNTRISRSVNFAMHASDIFITVPESGSDILALRGGNHVTFPGTGALAFTGAPEFSRQGFAESPFAGSVSLPLSSFGGNLSFGGGEHGGPLGYTTARVASEPIQDSVITRGIIEFEVNWSVNLTTAQRFSHSKIESISLVRKEWA